MIQQGTTTLEAKSGYGLDTENELKQLRVIRRLQEELLIDIVPTFMGAHEFPPEYRNNHSGYVELLCKEMIPAVAEQLNFVMFLPKHIHLILKNRVKYLVVLLNMD
jgi:imidazolonepropionase